MKKLFSKDVNSILSSKRGGLQDKIDIRGCTCEEKDELEKSIDGWD